MDTLNKQTINNQKSTFTERQSKNYRNTTEEMNMQDFCIILKCTNHLMLKAATLYKKII